METFSPPSQDRSLLERARRGDREAFSALVRTHRPGVRVFLGTHVRDRHALDDLLQDVFLRALHGLPTLRDPAAFHSWLLGIARHRVLEHLRERVRTANTDRQAFEALFDRGQIGLLESDDEDARTGVELEALRQCLRRLPAPGARLIREHYFKGRPLTWCAEQEGKNESTVRMTLFRLREGLRDCVRRRMARRGQA